MSKTSKQTTGILGENLAAESLQNKGFTIIVRNFRYRRGELDLIAKKDNVLVFVEVKTRSQTGYGMPETFVDQRKRKEIIRTAQAYLEESKHGGEIRFDIVSVLLDTKNGKPEIHHIEDAFFPYGD